MKNTYITVMKNGIDEVEVVVMVKGENQKITNNLKNVIIKEKKLSQILAKRIPKGENLYIVKRPKGFYKVLAKEVGVENLILALKELRSLSRELPDLGVSRFQELKLILSK